ncbi:MAG: hypoxanthine phosphoribosyltransferase [Alicyclobacillaceae bacterium]|nr:hypoxanthine phosphoribosyltransferase [Alicyclobacillaceae bacterium]
MIEDLKTVLFTEEQISRRIRELGLQLAAEYEGKHPLLVCVLKGAVLFMAELVKRMAIPLEMDFMAISSYGASTQSSGVVRILKDLDRDVAGRHVLIVEDIIDSGLTLSYLRDVLVRRNAASVKIVALFDKPERRSVPIRPDYCGFTVPNEFIVGYGLDYAERYRNLPCVGILKEDVYKGPDSAHT